MWITFVVSIMVAAGFAYTVLRDEKKQEDTKFLCVGVVCCMICFAVWINCWSSQGFQSKGDAIIFVLCSAAIGISWGGFFGQTAANKFATAFVHMVNGGSAGDVKKDYGRAVTHEVRGDFAKAIAAYHKYHEEDPKDYEVLERIARGYYRLKQAREAIEYLQKAIRLINDKNLKVKIKKDPREETARYLYLQKVIGDKLRISTVEQQTTLRNLFADTRFGKGMDHPDVLIESYLEVWGECIYES